MKIRDLFDMLGAAEDFLSFWEGVETVDQMVSRLEHLKRGDNPEGLLDDLHSLRICTAGAFAANIELGGALSQNEEADTGIDDLDKVLAELGEEEKVADDKTGADDNVTPQVETVAEKTPTS
jgi:hypothetical protein